MSDALTNAVLPLILAVAGAAVAWLTPRIQTLIGTQIERVRNEDLRNVLGVVGTIAGSVVAEIMQTIVSELKAARADGKLTSDEAAAALQKAITNTWAGLPQRIRELLTRTYGSEDAAKAAVIAPMVEREVLAAKALTPTETKPASELEEAEAQLRADAARRRLNLTP